MMTLADPIPQTRTRQVAWVGLRLAVPDAWEVIRHSVHPEKGSLVLVDRRRQRLQLLWTDVPRQPDLEHMVRDHEARELEADAQARFSRLTSAPGWTGLQRVLDGGSVVTRAIRWDAPTQRLLELVLLSDPADPADAAVVADVLDSVQVDCRGQAATHWKLFDLDVETPPGWRLERARVRPADVTFRFAEYDDQQRPTRNTAAVRRRGMADAWYRGDPQKLLRKELPRRGTTMSEIDVAGASAAEAHSIEPGKRYECFLGKLRDRRDVVWSWPSANAVYQITTFSRRRRPVEPSAFDVHFTHDLGPHLEPGAES